MIRSVQVTILIFGLINLTYSNTINDDPCLHVKCPRGEICIKSIDGFSFNCIKEISYSKNIKFGSNQDLNMAAKARDLFTNYPVNYFEKYMSFNPCLSSPCGPRKICRHIKNEKFICQSELELYSDTNKLRSFANIGLKQNIWTNLQKKFFNERRHNKITSLRAIKKKLEADDYEDINAATINNQLGDLCTKNHAKPGTKLANPLRISQYIICLTDNFIIRNCHRGSVFNNHSEKCEATTDIPIEHFRKSNPCLNNSTFVQTDKFQYKCECPAGFTGTHCEKKDICEASFCGMNGVCLGIGYTTVVSHLCWCNNGLDIGKDCDAAETLESNPCLKIDLNKKLHSLKLNPSVYVECGDENKPVLRTCQYPLVFSEDLQECDWKVRK